MVMDVGGTALITEPINSGQSRGSIHSLRRTSTDVRSIGSDYLRRTSFAKLSALPLEAPITKVSMVQCNILKKYLGLKHTR